MEFHHQSHLWNVAGGHTHTAHWLADCSPTSPVVGYLLPLSQPSIFLPSHIIKSPMGTLVLLPHHLSLFSLLLGEKGDSRKKNEYQGCLHRGIITDSLPISKVFFVFLCKTLGKRKRNKRSGNAEQRIKAVNHSHETSTRTYCIQLVIWVLLKLE